MSTLTSAKRRLCVFTSFRQESCHAQNQLALQYDAMVFTKVREFLQALEKFQDEVEFVFIFARPSFTKRLKLNKAAQRFCNRVISHEISSSLQDEYTMLFDEKTDKPADLEIVFWRKFDLKNAFAGCYTAMHWNLLVSDVAGHTIEALSAAAATT